MIAAWGLPTVAEFPKVASCSNIYIIKIAYRMSSWLKEVSLMEAKAFVLIETAVGKSKEVVRAIRGLEAVTSVDPVTGPYDVIAVVQGKTLDEIGTLVTEKIHPISGISRTVTCMAIK